MRMRPYAESGLLALDLAKTWNPYSRNPERAPGLAALRRFIAEEGIEGEPTARDLAAFHALRERLRRTFAGGAGAFVGWPLPHRSGRTCHAVVSARQGGRLSAGDQRAAGGPTYRAGRAEVPRRARSGGGGPRARPRARPRGRPLHHRYHAGVRRARLRTQARP